MGPLVIPAIMAGSQLLGTGINAASQGSMNRKTRDFTINMYHQQRKDALADFAMQNSYNSPTAQMQRLREAGLNPNLVYGSGVNMDAAPVRSSSVEGWKPQAPQFDIGSAGLGITQGLQAYQDLQVKEAQTDNLRTQNDLLEAEKMLKLAQMNQTLQQTETSKFDLEFKKEIREYSVNAAILANKRETVNIAKTEADTRYTLDENERKAVMQSYNIREAVQRIMTMRINNAKTQQETINLRQQLKLMMQDETLKAYEIQLNKMGVQKNDGFLWRILGNYINSFNGSGGGSNGSLTPGEKLKYQKNSSGSRR